MVLNYYYCRIPDMIGFNGFKIWCEMCLRQKSQIVSQWWLKNGIFWISLYSRKNIEFWDWLKIGHLIWSRISHQIIRICIFCIRICQDACLIIFFFSTFQTLKKNGIDGCCGLKQLFLLYTSKNWRMSQSNETKIFVVVKKIGFETKTHNKKNCAFK